MKNPTFAAILGFVFGPAGLLYVSVTHAVLAFLGIVVIGIVTGGIGALPVWCACAYFGYQGATKINEGLAQPSEAAARFTAASSSTLPAAASPPDAAQFCTACSQRLALTARFCNKCGAATAA